jgi:hypothetical protein
MTDAHDWKKVKIAEDELSVLWKKTAQIETSEQMMLAAKESQKDNFWPHIEALAIRCDEILTEHGFPHAIETVWHDETGKWFRPLPDTGYRPPTGETWKLNPGGALAQKHAADFSDAWYAGRLGIKCRLALEIFQKDKVEKSSLFNEVFEIATLRTDWGWRRGQKPSILTGRKTRRNLTDLRETQNRYAQAGVTERHSAIAAMLQTTNRTGGALTSWIRKQLVERHEITVSERTIRGDLKELRQ